MNAFKNEYLEASESIQYTDEEGIFGSTTVYKLLPDCLEIKSAKNSFQRSLPLITLEKVQLKIGKDQNSLILSFKNEKPICISTYHLKPSEEFKPFTIGLHKSLRAISSRAQFVIGNKGQVFIGAFSFIAVTLMSVGLGLYWIPTIQDPEVKTKAELLYPSWALIIVGSLNLIRTGWMKQYDPNDIPQKFLK